MHNFVTKASDLALIYAERTSKIKSGLYKPLFTDATTSHLRWPTGYHARCNERTTDYHQYTRYTIESYI